MNKIKLMAEIDLETQKIGVAGDDFWLQLGCFMEVVAMLAAATVGKNQKGIETTEEMADYVASYITEAMMVATPNAESTN